MSSVIDGEGLGHDCEIGSFVTAITDGQPPIYLLSCMHLTEKYGAKSYMIICMHL